MYDCESWLLTLKEENKHLVAGSRIPRKILEPVKGIDGIYRIQKNAEIEDLVAEPKIIGETKSA